MSVTPYDVLGVAPTATPDEVAAAHRRLALIYHPDRYQTAPADVKAEVERRMKEINRAYDELRVGAAAHPSAPAWAPSDAHSKHQEAASYVGPYCMLCGSAPVVSVDLKQGVGLLLARRVKTFSGSLCRDCGTAMYRAVQNATLWTGWWGIISFFANFAYIASNLTAYSSIRGLAPPSSTPMSHLTPLPRPAPTGRPMLGRSGVWFVAIVVIWIGVAIANNNQPTSSSPPTVPGITSTICGYELGDTIYTVPCYDSRATLTVLQILPSGSDPQSCPIGTESYTNGIDGLLCWGPA